jgi:serine phosphatase RsbU (regulator of sigma subunit)
MDLIHELYKSVIAFSGGTPQKDDLTAVVIKRT